MTFSRKGAKAQRKIRLFVFPLRLCAFAGDISLTFPVSVEHDPVLSQTLRLV